jgi:hypothetical protein
MYEARRVFIDLGYPRVMNGQLLYQVAIGHFVPGSVFQIPDLNTMEDLFCHFVHIGRIPRCREP